MPNLVAQNVEILLDVGNKLVIVGANESGISQFRIAGEDRYEFMSVGTAKQLKELPGKNYTIALVNGRLPEEVLTHIQTICDRSKVHVMYVTKDGGALIRAMQNYPKGVKGVVSFKVPEVIQTIELNKAPNPRKPAPPPPGPQPPPPKPNPAFPFLHSMEEILANLETYYDRFNGDHNKIIAHLRELGITEEQKTFGALYQRVLAIRKRREKNSARGQENTGSLPQLLASQKGAGLLASMEELRTAVQRTLELAGQVAEENQQLRTAAEAQNERIQSLAGVEAENRKLRSRLEPFLDAAAQAARIE